MEFTTESGTLRAKINFDREVWFVRAHPAARRNADGSTSLGLNFPIVAITGWVQGGDKIADLIARLLTEHYAKEEAA